MKHNLRKDVVPGALFLILGVVLWVLTPSQIRTSETSFFTARTFPYIVLGIIILCSAALLVSGVVRVLAERRAQRGDTHAEAPAEKNVKMLLLVAGHRLRRRRQIRGAARGGAAAHGRISCDIRR